MIDAVRACWPQRLRHQLLLLLITVVISAMALLAVISHSRLANAADEGARTAAAGVARAAARAAAANLAAGDPVALASAMRDVAALPGVLGLDLLDAAGQPRLSLRTAPHGEVQLLAQPDVVRVPQPGEREWRQLRVGELDAVQVWAPVGVRAGSVALTMSLEDRRAELSALRYDSVLAIGAVGLLAIAAVYAFVVRALTPLQALAGFSHELVDRPGRQLERPASSKEAADLADALNHASTALCEQLDEIRATEGRTHAILNAAPDTIVGLDSGLAITLVNPAVTSVFGYNAGDLAGRPLQLLLPRIDAAEAERLTLQGLYMRTSGSHVARLETTARRHDGTEFPAEVSLSRIEGADGVHYACVVRDVTEQRMTYSMLNLYSRALECTSNGVVISDMSLPGQPLFYANPAFARITGYEVSEVIGRNCKLLQRDDAAQPEIETLREAVAHGQSVTVVLRNYRKDGTLFFNELAIAPVADADGSVRHYVGVINDVSERERARLALAERSARLNAVFDLSPDGYVVFDRDGVMAYCNRAFRRMTGWGAEVLDSGLTLAQFDQQLRAQCDAERPYPSIAQLGAGGEGSFDAEDLLELAMPQRAVLTRLARCNVGEQGESILYFRDVTHETEVDRMKSEFLTTAAHELRTPMVSVFGFTELLLSRPVPEARRRDVLETIHRQASILINMVNELLDLARIEARQGKDLRRSAQRLGPLVQQAVDGLMMKGDGRRVQLGLRHAEAWLLVDPEKTVQALTNVLSNAYKYSPGGGEIRLDTLDGQLAAGPAVGLRVSDQGLGMTPQQLARVFERFYRADPSGNIPGTGLGMCLVKEIVELQQGQVELESEPGRGTRVTLWLPQASAAAVAEACTEAGAAQ